MQISLFIKLKVLRLEKEIVYSGILFFNPKSRQPIPPEARLNIRENVVSILPIRDSRILKRFTLIFWEDWYENTKICALFFPNVYVIFAP